MSCAYFFSGVKFSFISAAKTYNKASVELRMGSNYYCGKEESLWFRTFPCYNKYIFSSHYSDNFLCANIHFVIFGLYPGIINGKVWW